MAKPKTDFPAILLRLAMHHVDFIVVGGVGAVLRGAPVATFDLDVVHSRDPENVDRLLKALESMDAHYREPVAPRIKPNLSHLSSSGHQLLMTCFGPLDLLGVIGAERDYRSLFPESNVMEVSAGVEVRVLSLPAIIKTKEETGGEKDRAVLPTLRRTLQEKSRF